MRCTMRAKTAGESVQIRGNRYTAGADRIVRDVHEDDAAELTQIGWRRMVAAVARGVVVRALITERGITMVTTPTTNRPDASPK
jgi:hypothetical protein